MRNRDYLSARQPHLKPRSWFISISLRSHGVAALYLKQCFFSALPYTAGVAAIPISLFARFPAPGLAKTRLISAIGPQGAAMVHRRLVERTTAMLRASDLIFEVRTTGASAEEFSAWLGDDVHFIDQGAGDLGARLARVVAPAIVIGADSPGLTPAILYAAIAALDERPAVIGPAFDGGYYLLGFRESLPFLFTEMRWGTDGVFAETLRRLDERNIETYQLESLYDIDRPEDLARWPEFAA